METHGIETIKKALKFAGNFTNAIVKALEDDGKIKGGEYFQIAFTLPGLFPVIKNFQELTDEFYELNKAEYEELKSFFSTEFDIPNDQVEDKIERAFNLVLAIIEQLPELIEKEPEV